MITKSTIHYSREAGQDGGLGCGGETLQGKYGRMGTFKSSAV